MKHCSFTTNITDEIECDPNSEFDELGFSKNKCEEFPCKRYKELKVKIDKNKI